jgi:hypothetical protein
MTDGRVTAKRESELEILDGEDEALCTCCRLKQKFDQFHVDPSTACRDFAHELDRAAEDDGPFKADGGRNRAAASLNVVIHFLQHGLKEHQLNLGPLYALVAALDDLDRGALPLMLRPRKVAHRPPEQSCRDQIKKFAAVTCTALMRTRLTREEAAKRVLKTLLDVGFFVGERKTPTYRTILNWRNRVELRDDPDEELQTTRSAILEVFAEAKNPVDELLVLSETRKSLLVGLARTVRYNCQDLVRSSAKSPTLKR